jgi:antitoxin VapB
MVQWCKCGVYDSWMALNIKNRLVEDLATEIARLTGDSKTEAIRRALESRRAELMREGRPGSRKIAVQRYLENEVWPLIPLSERGRRLSREEEDAILGYGTEGV